MPFLCDIRPAFGIGRSFYAGATDLPVEHVPWQLAVIIGRRSPWAIVNGMPWNSAPFNTPHGRNTLSDPTPKQRSRRLVGKLARRLRAGRISAGLSTCTTYIRQRSLAHHFPD